MSGATEYRSEAMKDDFNRYGLVKFNDGINIASISGAKKLASGEKLTECAPYIFFATAIIFSTMDISSLYVYCNAPDGVLSIVSTTRLARSTAPSVVSAAFPSPPGIFPDSTSDALANPPDTPFRFSL